MPDCIFCKIISKEAEADILFEDDAMIAFRDIRPKAPVHVLIAPKEHRVNLDAYTAEHADVLGRLLLRAAALAKTLGIATSGYKVVTNIGDDGGQIIHHFHFHLLGGEPIRVVV